MTHYLFDDSDQKEILSLCDIEPFKGSEHHLQRLVEEIHYRATQLNLLYKLSEALEKDMNSRGIRAIDLVGGKKQLLLKAQVFAEAFYFFAWRIVEITEYLKRFLSSKTTKCDPKGVRRVRNNLIMHPQKHPKPILSISFHHVFDGKGLRLKHLRKEGENKDPIDVGLFANAEELKACLLSWIRMVKSIHSQQN